MQPIRTLVPKRLNPGDLHPGENKITFISKSIAGDLLLAGLLYLPPDFDAAATTAYPAIVLAGAFNQVKEQTCATYARKLAARGFIALSFDPPGYGDSEGAVRNLEHAPAKIAAIQDVASFLCMHPFVDRSRVFAVGVCAGASHVAYAALTDRRFRRVALVGGMLMNVFVHFAAGAASIDADLAAANAARQAFYETGAADPVDVLGMDDGSAKNSAIRDQREGYDYYMTARAGAQRFPNYSHRTPRFFLEDNARYSARAIAGVLATPAVVIYGSRASTRVFSLLFALAKTGPKRLVRIAGATHVDLYDRDEHVDRAVDAIEGYFRDDRMGNVVSRAINTASAFAIELAPVVLPLGAVVSVALAMYYRGNSASAKVLGS